MFSIRLWTAGARHMTHFMNAMTPLHHRAPGPVGWGLMNDQVTCDLIADGIHLDPSILKLILRNKTSKRVSLISDAIAATGLGDGEYQIWGETIVVEERPHPKLSRQHRRFSDHDDRRCAHDALTWIFRE